MAITATTKHYEVIPYDDGQGNTASQVLKIPASVIGSADQFVNNPDISIENPTTHETGIDFWVRIRDGIGNNYLVADKFLYDEVFTLLAPEDFSAFYNSGATDAVSFLTYLMGSMTEVYERLLLQVPWLKGKIQEKP